MTLAQHSYSLRLRLVIQFSYMSLISSIIYTSLLL